MVKLYWEIGRIIVEEEQKGSTRAEYGSFIISSLSKKLSKDFGKGFDESNLRRMRMFFIAFRIRAAVRHELTWTHYKLILSLELDAQRDFYINESIKNRWSSRELNRQINKSLYERVVLSKNREKTIQSIKDPVLQTPGETVKDPYILDFLNINPNSSINESELEEALISNVENFLIELGKGFAFVGRQQRLQIGDKNFYVDLVFYNFILKCFVLIELKTDELIPQDIGQIDFYVRYFEQEIKQENDNPTIGIILCAKKDEVVAKYTLLGANNKIFASKYKLYLPSEKELKDEISRRKALFEINQKTK